MTNVICIGLEPIISTLKRIVYSYSREPLYLEIFTNKCVRPLFNQFNKPNKIIKGVVYGGFNPQH